MAIYKPSNCMPFLDSLDLSEDQDIQCELNTSNNQVVGYKIRIMDSQNKEILQGPEFTSLNDDSLIKYDNTCLNGSVLTLPLVVSSPEYSNKNNIFFGGYSWGLWKPDFKTIMSSANDTGLTQHYFRISTQTVVESTYDGLTTDDIYVKINGYYRTLTSQEIPKPAWSTIDDDEYYCKTPYYFKDKHYVRISTQTIVESFYNDSLDTDTIYVKVNGYYRTLTSQGISQPDWSNIDDYEYYYEAGTSYEAGVSDGYTAIYISNPDSGRVVLSESDYMNITDGIYTKPSAFYILNKPTKQQAIDDHVYYRWYKIIDANTMTNDEYSLLPSNGVYKRTSLYSATTKPSTVQEASIEELYYNCYYTAWDTKPSFQFAYYRCYYKDAGGNMQLFHGDTSDYANISIFYDKICDYMPIDQLNRPSWDSSWSINPIYYRKDYYALLTYTPTWEEISGSPVNNYYYLIRENTFARITNETIRDNVVSAGWGIYRKDLSFNALTPGSANSTQGIFVYSLLGDQSLYQRCPLTYSKAYISVAGLDENFYKNNIFELYTQSNSYSNDGLTKPDSLLQAAYLKYYYLDTTPKPVTYEYCEYNDILTNTNNIENNLAVHDKGAFYVINYIQYETLNDAYNNAMCYLQFSSVTAPDNKNEAILSHLYYEEDGNYYLITEDMSDTVYDSKKSNIYKFDTVTEFVSGDSGDDPPEYVQYRKLDNFYNGYIYQPYKWQIDLMQGDPGVTDIQDVRSKWFDMQITNGTVLGSCPTRLHGLFSDEIYKDYYVQLYSYSSNTFSPIGNRVRIDSYDGSFGYVYPQKGFISETNISDSSYFAVYKYTNDPEYVSANRKVNYATTVDINTVIFGSSGIAENFKKVQNSSYYTQVYNGQVTAANILINKYDTSYTGSEAMTLGIGGTSLLIKNQVTSSALNGVYYLDSLNYDSDTQKTTFKWLRTADASSFSDFINGVFYIISGSYSGKNFISNAVAGGTLDSTALLFTEEKAVLLYPEGNVAERLSYYSGVSDITAVDGNDLEIMKYYSPLFKNSSGKTYIRPFIGIQKDMRFQYGENVYESVLISDIDTNVWSITHAALQFNRILQPNVDKYIISSYYKTSDENPFYAYTKPYIDINIKNITGGVDNFGVPIIINRYVISDASYIQEQNKSWKNYQWILYDITNDLEVEKSDIIYSGSFENKFIGIENNNKYRLKLIVENEMGYSQEVYQDFILFANLEYGALPITVSPQCMSQSVDMSIVRVGLVEPVPTYASSDIISYKNNEQLMEISDEEANRNYAIKYISALSAGRPISIVPPKNNKFRVISSHELGQYYQGSVIKYIFNEYENINSNGAYVNPSEDDIRFVLEVICEPDTLINNNGEIVKNVNRGRFNIKFNKEKYSSGEWNIDSELINKQYIWRSIFHSAFSLVEGKDVSTSYDYLYTTQAYSLSSGQLISGWYNLASPLYDSLINSEQNTLYEFIYPYNSKSSSYAKRTSNVNYSPLYNDSSSEGLDTFGCWFDEIVEYKSQSGLLLTQRQGAYWVDDGLYWQDNSKGFYEQVDANAEQNHSGKQYLMGHEFIFDISVFNYNSDLQTGVFDSHIDVWMDGSILTEVNNNG